MRKINKRISGFLLVLGFICSFSKSVYAQRRTQQATGYGGSIIYNFATTGLGLDLRMKIPLRGRFFIVPEISCHAAAVR